MKTQNILFLLLSFLTFATYAQTEKSVKVESKSAVTELNVKTENLEELKNFDWNMVKEMFQENDAEQEITLAFSYVNKSEIDKSIISVDNFEMKFTGKTADLEKLTASLKMTFDRLVEIDGRNIAN